VRTRRSSVIECAPMPRDHDLHLPGTRLHYIEWGERDAPAVVLLHGITGHARTWDDEARALAARYRVLALDQRGHGDSDPAPDGDYTVTTMAADLAAFADALRLRHFSVVGLSMGGRVAIAFAGSQPERVERLIVVDIGPDIAPGGRLRVGAMMAQTPERFDDLETAIAWARTANPRYTDTMLRHRVVHGTRPVDGGLVWKYDRPPGGRLARWYGARRFLLHELYNKIDTRKFAMPDDPFQPVALDARLSGVPVLEVTPRRTKHCDYLADADVERILAHDLDVAIRLGFRILRGRFLEIARHGVWSYHHGDNRVNRGGPPGF